MCVECAPGVVSGLLGQMNDIAVLPAYLISLSFTFNLKRGSGHVYWPGCAFGIVSFLVIIIILTVNVCLLTCILYDVVLDYSSRCYVSTSLRSWNYSADT